MPRLELDRTYATIWDYVNPAEDADDPSTVVLGHRYTALVDGYVVGMRYLADPAYFGMNFGFLEHVDTFDRLRMTQFHTVESPDFLNPKWQHAYFQKRYFMQAGDEVIGCVWFIAGGYWRSLNALDGADLGSNGITIKDNTLGTMTSMFTYDPNLHPSSTYGNTAYGIDLLFQKAM